MGYRHIMLAVDLTEDSDQIAQKAKTIASLTGAKISTVHVIEPINFAYGGDIPMDLTTIQTQLEEHAQNRLNEFVKNNGLPVEGNRVIAGLPQSEIHRLAEEDDIDLIVIGSHGRHGLALLLGSTSNGVLHGAKCDVLAVHINKS